MWTCPECNRIFNKTNQPHSCKIISLQKHFENKKRAEELFEYLVKKIADDIGECKIISIPCCIHLFGKYDFLAALPKKDRLEVRFALNRNPSFNRIKQTVPMSSKVLKICIEVFSEEEIDKEFISMLRESYHLKD